MHMQMPLCSGWGGGEPHQGRCAPSLFVSSCKPLGGNTGPASCAESTASQEQGVLATGGEASMCSGFLSPVVLWACIHPFTWTLAQIRKTGKES